MAKVLLVEDDNNLREIYQARLTAEGYDIVAAQDGEEALVVAKQEHPDLIISDVMMPRISGFEMLDILRNTDELKHTKIIMLTALGQAEDQSRADTLGADKYLVKSQVTLEDIINSAKELLGDSPAPASTEPAAPTNDQPAATPVTAEPAVVSASEPAVQTATEPVVSPASTVINVDPAVVPSEPAPVTPVTNETAVPASVTPQADTTVVVPPAPANPEPPMVTSVPVADPGASAAADDTSATPTPPTTPAAGPAEVADQLSSVAATEPAYTPSAGSTITPDVDASEHAVSDSTPQSIASEEAALEAQIKQFTEAPAESAPEQAPAATDLLPSDAVTPTDQAEVNDAAVIANAVDQLNVKPADTEAVATNQTAAVTDPSTAVSPPPAAELSAAETAPQASSNEQVSINGKKVIAPLGNPENKPSLQELLAREDAKETGAAPAPQAPVVNGETATTPPTQKPGNSFDPNSISL